MIKQYDSTLNIGLALLAALYVAAVSCGFAVFQ